MAYTFVVAIGFAIVGASPKNEWGLAAVLVIPMLALPSLFERAIDRKFPLPFGASGAVLQAIAVSLYSCLGLLLSSFAFGPAWKGSKGMNWIFYVNDGAAAVVLVPIYFIGAYAFLIAISRPRELAATPFVVAGVGINAAISLMYIFYVFALNFTGGRGLHYGIVPGVSFVAYFLMTIALYRRFDLFDETNVNKKWFGAIALAGSTLVAMVAKIPLAHMKYQTLRDTAPDDCFIVTAASRGHRTWVGTFYDPNSDRHINGQLVHLWRFESLLARHVPNFHQRLRRIYNILGPKIARQIRGPWQADIVYLMLKPIEWTVRLIVWMAERRK